MKQAVFLIQTIDRKGLLSQISGFFFKHGLNILHCEQYSDELDGKYFMRVRIDVSNMEMTRRELYDDFKKYAAVMEVERFEVHYLDEKQRMAIMVSKTSHCLYDLLMHQQDGDLNCEIPLIISNHPDLEHVADQFRIPYYSIPIINGDKAAQEAKVIELLERHLIDLVVMARYMQVLSDSFCQKFENRIINIHHAFLPAFQGGNPYHRAWERGVKMIGATAHYATPDLDEGPIIEQDVERVSHRDTPDSLRQLGKDIERRVLTRAVKAHLDHRVIISGRRTIVMS
ncbi:MAG: formyltetrahydrofolate deformylase [Victivallaceae bacterium]